MKFAIVTHNVIRGDGQGRVNYEFVRFLLDRGDDVTLFADAVDETLIQDGVRWIHVRPGFEEIDLLKVWRFRMLANRALRNHSGSFDRIVACGVVTDHPHDLNVAHFVHGTWIRSPFHDSKIRKSFRSAYQWVFSSLNARWERQVFDSARQVGAVSAMVRDELATIGVAPEKLVVLGNGVDTDEFKPGPAVRRDFGLPEDVPVALFVGDLQSSIKNLDTLLAAAKHVPNLHVAVAGRPEGSPFPAMADSMGLSNRVHFLGFQRDVAGLMRACDFFVLVSRRDSCPLVVLEALASGLPVVTATTVGNADLVGDRCGFVVDNPEDVDGVADALRKLSDNTELRDRLSQNARQQALQHSWERMSMRYLDALGIESAEDIAEELT